MRLLDWWIRGWRLGDFTIMIIHWLRWGFIGDIMDNTIWLWLLHSHGKWWWPIEIDGLPNLKNGGSFHGYVKYGSKNQEQMESKSQTSSFEQKSDETTRMRSGPFLKMSRFAFTAWCFSATSWVGQVDQPMGTNLGMWSVLNASDLEIKFM